MEKSGNQSRRDGETYAEWMDRLYRPTPYANQKRDEKSGSFLPSSTGTERPKWSFRVPNVLAAKALKFMRDEQMSVTKYLTFAMHQHLNNSEK